VAAISSPAELREGRERLGFLGGTDTSSKNTPQGRGRWVSSSDGLAEVAWVQGE